MLASYARKWILTNRNGMRNEVVYLLSVILMEANYSRLSETASCFSGLPTAPCMYMSYYYLLLVLLFAHFLYNSDGNYTSSRFLTY